MRAVPWIMGIALLGGCDDGSEEAAANASKAEPARGAEPAAAVRVVIQPGSVGPITSAIRVDALPAALSGYKAEFIQIGSHDTWIEVLSIKRSTFEDPHLPSMTVSFDSETRKVLGVVVEDPSIKDHRGNHVGSALRELAAGGLGEAMCTASGFIRCNDRDVPNITYELAEFPDSLRKSKPEPLKNLPPELVVSRIEWRPQEDFRDGTRFSVEFKGGKKQSAPIGCFTSLDPPWTVMVGRDPKKPCAYDEEDGYSITFDMKLSGEFDVWPLPSPGEIFKSDLSVRGKSYPAKIRVLRHERPYVIVAIEAEGNPSGRGPVTTFGGEMRVRLEPIVGKNVVVRPWWR